MCVVNGYEMNFKNAFLYVETELEFGIVLRRALLSKHVNMKYIKTHLTQRKVLIQTFSPT